MKKMVCLIAELDDSQDVDEFIKKIRYACGEFDIRTIEGTTWQSKLKYILKSLGITTAVLGYEEIVSIIAHVADDPEQRKSLYLNAIYIDMERETGLGKSVITRRIRSVINMIETNNDREDINELLGISEESSIELKPHKFLSLLIDRVL